MTCVMQIWVICDVCCVICDVCCVLQKTMWLDRNLCISGSTASPIAGAQQQLVARHHDVNVLSVSICAFTSLSHPNFNQFYVQGQWKKAAVVNCNVINTQQATFCLFHRFLEFYTATVDVAFVSPLITSAAFTVFIGFRAFSASYEKWHTFENCYIVQDHFARFSVALSSLSKRLNRCHC